MNCAGPGLSKSPWGTRILGNTQFKRTSPGGGTPTYPGEPNEHQRWFNAQLHDMNPDLSISVPIRISQSADDQRVKAQTMIIGPIRVPGTDELVGELRLTNQGCSPELLYRRYPASDNDEDDRVIVPDPDRTGLGAHFATINHDLPELTAWLSELFNAKR